MTMASDWVTYNARRFGPAPALESGDTGERVSWVDLEERVARIAGLLRGRYGVSHGDRVAVIADNDMRIFMLQFAAMRLGAILVPLNWRLSLGELEALCADSQPAVLAHDLTWHNHAEQLAAAVGAQLLSWSQPGSDHDLDELAASADPMRDEGLRAVDDFTHILYTSGTTGIPKGALVTGRTLSWHTLNIAEVDDITGPGDRMLVPLPLFHAGGLNTLSNPILMQGGCVTVLRRFDPQQCLGLLGDPRAAVTHFASVPTMYQMMSDLPQFAQTTFSTIKHLQIAGGTASRKLLDAWASRGVQLMAHYGGTEMGPAITAMPAASVDSKLGACGFPVRHTRMRLVSPAGEDVGVGEVGEVWITGPAVTPGYFRNPSAMAESFVGEWFRTGDAGRLDEDGYLYLVDRYKDMYKSGGENVFPAEVERILLEHPDVSEVVVVGVPDARWGETGVAVIVARAGTAPTHEDIAQFCNGRIARYKVPSTVHLVETLPRNATGKVVKADIKARYGPAPMWA